MVPQKIYDYSEQLGNKLQLMYDNTLDFETEFQNLFNAIVEYIEYDRSALIEGVTGIIYSYYTLSYMYGSDNSLINNADAVNDVFNINGLLSDILNYDMNYYSETDAQGDPVNLLEDTQSALDAMNSEEDEEIFNNITDPMVNVISETIEELNDNVNDDLENPSQPFEFLDKERNTNKILDDLRFDHFRNVNNPNFNFSLNFFTRQ